MAITSLDLAIAGERPFEEFSKAVTGALVAGRPFSTFYLAGVPGAAVAPSPGLSGESLTSYAGQIPVPAASGNSHLSYFQCGSSAQAGSVMLADRLWHNSGFTITITTAQAVNSVAWPARDKAGTTNGAGVYLGVEVSAATGAGTPTITVSYTNSQNVSGRTGTNSVATVATSAAGTFYPIGLQAGDVGVRSVQSLTLSATWTSGTIHLVAYRPIIPLTLPTAGIFASLNAVTGNLPRLYDNTVPFLIYRPQTSATTNLSGGIKITQG
jgi:hypothetical protein